MSSVVTLSSELSERVKQEEFERRVVATLSRTPEQIAEAKTRILSLTPEPRSLPAGKTLEDVFVGALPDDKTEEEVIRSLQAVGR